MTQADQSVAGSAAVAPEVMLQRALRNTLILGLIPSLALWAGWGWRNAAMLATGTLISAASIWEWQRLVRLVKTRLDKDNARLDKDEAKPGNEKPRAGAPVAVLFFMLRLILFAGAIYVSLRCFQGSSPALLCGLGLAVATVGWEALRMLRD